MDGKMVCGLGMLQYDDDGWVDRWLAYGYITGE